MLERHPDLAIPPESYFPVSLHAKHSGSLDRAALAGDLALNPRFADWGLSEAATRSALAGATDYASAMRSLYSAYAASAGKRRYGDKTPAFVLHMELLASLFPEARFIHLIRDGRDVAASLVETEFGPGRITRAAEVWTRRVTRGRASGRALGPGRYFEFHYEALVDDTASTLKDICASIELDMRSDMLEPSRDTVIPQRELAHHGSLSKPVTKGLRDWRRDMPPRDVAAVEAVAGEMLSELGYERAYPSVPLTARVRAGVEHARSQATRRLRRGARAARGGNA